MTPELKEQIMNMIDQAVSQKLMSTFNRTVPRHVHNGVDSPLINKTNAFTIGTTFFNGTNGVIKGDLTLDTLFSKNIQVKNAGNSGINFINGSNIQYNIYEGNPSTDGSGFIIEPSTGTFMGVGGTFFIGAGPVSGGVFSNVITTVGNGTDTTTSHLGPNLMAFASTGNFAVQLPDNPLDSPLAGRFGFNDEAFQACWDGSNYEYIVTSDGSLTGATTASGTVEVTINGFPFNILFA